MADDYLSTMAKQPDLSEEEQKRMGQSKPGDMGKEHQEFLKTITGLIDRGEIDVNRPDTFLKQNLYGKLSDSEKTQVDIAMVSVAIQLYHIEGFYRSKKTPDSSPELELMIEHLWDMLQRLGKAKEVFKF